MLRVPLGRLALAAAPHACVEAWQAGSACMHGAHAQPDTGRHTRPDQYGTPFPTTSLASLPLTASGAPKRYSELTGAPCL